MMLTATIKHVSDVPNTPYSGQYGDTWFIDGEFENGEYFSRGAKSVANAQALVDQLRALVGQECSFEVEDSNKQRNGRKKWNIKSYPGKPGADAPRGNFGGRPSGGGGFQKSGGGSYQPRYRDSEQGAKEERNSIARQVALKAAVELSVAGKNATVDGCVAMANMFYQWITAIDPKPAATEAAPDTATKKEAGPYERYSNEINKAMKEGNLGRLEELGKMVPSSLMKGSINQDQAAALEDELIDAKKAVTAAKNQAEWIKRKQEEARKNEPLHTDPRMAQTLAEAEEVF